MIIHKKTDTAPTITMTTKSKKTSLADFPEEVTESNGIKVKVYGETSYENQMAVLSHYLHNHRKEIDEEEQAEIIEAIRLTSNKYVEIIRAGEDRYFVVAVGKDEVTVLGEISSDQLKDIDMSNSMESTMDFKAILEKFSKKEKN